MGEWTNLFLLGVFFDGGPTLFTLLLGKQGFGKLGFPCYSW